MTGSNPPQIQTSASGGRGTWSKVQINQIVQEVTGFSCLCASGSKLLLGTHSGSAGAPKSVVKSQLIFVGPAGGPFEAVVDPGGEWAGSGTHGYMTACASNGISTFLVAIAVPDQAANVLLISNDNGATWAEKTTLPPSLTPQGTLILSILWAERWILSGVSTHGQPVVSFDDPGGSLEWIGSGKWTTSTAFQEKRGLAAKIDVNGSANTYVIGRRGVGTAPLFAVSGGAKPALWNDATSTTPKLGVAYLILDVQYSTFSDKFYAIVSSDSRCQWYGGQPDGTVWSETGTLTGKCTAMAIGKTATTIPPETTLSTAVPALMTTTTTTIATTMTSSITSSITTSAPVSGRISGIIITSIVVGGILAVVLAVLFLVHRRRQSNGNEISRTEQLIPKLDHEDD